MQLDLRKPSFVLAGNWNPAIFRTEWIAEHIFGIPKGSKFQYQMAEERDTANEKTLRTIRYFKSVGLNVTPERFELFINRTDIESISGAEDFLQNISDALPHTPLAAVGLNFQFIEPEPSDELLDTLVTKDSLNQYYKIVSETHQSRIEEEDCFLNFTWKVENSSVFLVFNYHYEVDSDLKSIRGEIAGRYDRDLRRAEKLLKDVYNLSEYTVAGHEEIH